MAQGSRMRRDHRPVSVWVQDSCSLRGTSGPWSLRPAQEMVSNSSMTHWERRNRCVLPVCSCLNKLSTTPRDSWTEKKNFSCVFFFPFITEWFHIKGTLLPRPVKRFPLHSDHSPFAASLESHLSKFDVKNYPYLMITEWYAFQHLKQKNTSQLCQVFVRLWGKWWHHSSPVGIRVMVQSSIGYLRAHLKSRIQDLHSFHTDLRYEQLLNGSAAINISSERHNVQVLRL